MFALWIIIIDIQVNGKTLFRRKPEKVICILFAARVNRSARSRHLPSTVAIRRFRRARIKRIKRTIQRDVTIGSLAHEIY